MAKLLKQMDFAQRLGAYSGLQPSWVQRKPAVSDSADLWRTCMLQLSTPPSAGSSSSPMILNQESLRTAAAGPPSERKEGYVLKKSSKFFGPK